MSELPQVRSAEAIRTESRQAYNDRYPNIKQYTDELHAALARAYAENPEAKRARLTARYNIMVDGELFQRGFKVEALENEDYHRKEHGAQRDYVVTW